MKGYYHRHTTGQSLFFVAVVSFVLFGVLAIALDMGNAYYMRRWAQNAADAAALAAARQYCDYKRIDIATATAEHYVQGYGSELYNLATGVISQTLIQPIDIRCLDEDKCNEPPETSGVFAEVTVKVKIEHPTFIARLFNIQSMTAPATASAGCMAGLSTTIIPIAWYCLEPENEEYCVNFSEDPTCTIGEDHYYVFFGDESVSDYLWCEHWDDPPDENAIRINCEWPDTGSGKFVEPISTITTEHKWEGVDLNGDNCPQQELKDIIRGILQISFPPPGTWLDQCEGGLPPSFDIIKTDFLESNLSIPAFDKYCEGTNPSNGECTPDLWEDGDSQIDYDQGPGTRWYHLHSTPSLHVTCVKGAAPETCAARDFLLDDPDVPAYFINSVMSLEGCFVEDTGPDVVPCPGCPDVGTWTVILTQ